MEICQILLASYNIKSLETLAVISDKRSANKILAFFERYLVWLLPSVP